MATTTQISSLITELRRQSNKDSITPESVGYILAQLLQAIEDVANQRADPPKVPTFLYDSQTRALYITY